MTLQEAIDTFLDATAGEIADSTHAWYASMLASMAAYLGGNRPVESLSPADMRAWRSWIRKQPTQRGGPPSQSSLNGHTKAARRLFSWLMNEGMTDSNPAKALKIRKLKQVPKAISEEDYRAILAAAEADGLRSKLIVLLLADTGCRINALASAKVEHISLREADQSGSLLLREKGSRMHRVYFGAETYKALVFWLEKRPTRTPWLFPSRTNPGHLMPSTMRYNLYRLARDAGASGRCNPHSFRHRYARTFLQRGGNLAALQRLMGHADVSITARYYAVWAESELADWHKMASPAKAGLS